MALRYRVPLPGPFYYSGRVGPKHWLPRSRQRPSTGIVDTSMRWFVIYPGVALMVASLALLAAPCYGLYRLIRWALQEQKRQQVQAQRFLVQRPLPQRPAPRPAPRPYGFVPAQRPAQPVPYGFVPAQRPVQAPVYAIARRTVAR
nr:MAG TPA: hypothetical protein [Bacteriophage sp.]